ncbi:MAG: SusC/RagA family TonB-linked outer membrane protein [Tannerella sp.]|jgi:TonB-linked SusC/RagA family outer membrane protein|nr:SusC/RagA family TonB-linked outer membrane protein [Tannerella sp.]
MNRLKFYTAICCLLLWTAAGAQQADREKDQEENKTVSLGYFSQSESALTGAVETVSGAVLEKTPSADLSQTFAGRFLGLNTLELQSELSNALVSKLIRGISTVNGAAPLIVIDGMICPDGNWDYLTPKEIESISILKDASTTSVYGMQGAGGAIVITTKRGFVGKKTIEAYADQSFQQMTRKPAFIPSTEYAALRNQAGLNDGLGAYSQFGQEVISGFGEGNNPLYPNNDWYGMFVNDVTYMQRAGLNVAGGSERIRYFSNVHYMHQSSPLKTADEPERNYDPTPSVHSFNFRSNVDVNLNSYLNGFLRVSGNVNRQQTARNGNTTIYNRIFNLPPTMYGPVTPASDEAPETGNQVVTHDQEDAPAYGLLNRAGYVRLLETSILSQAGLTLDMSFLTPGLSATGRIAYQTYANNITYTPQDFERYVRSNDYSVLEFTKKGTNENTPLSYNKGSLFFYNLNLFANAAYKRTFGEHSIDALAYVFYLQQEKEITSEAQILPYKRESMGVTALYGFKNRYFLKGDLGYSGSEQFHPDHRYVATPAVSAAWIVSGEDFLAGNDLLTWLKLRLSWGINANDQLGDARFMYLDYYDTAGNEGLKGNPNLSAEKIKKQNYGIEAGWLNAFTLRFDYFVHKCDNMLVSSAGTIPVYQGIALNNYPKLNNGRMENRGFEASLLYSRQISKDLSVCAGAGLHQNRNKVLEINEASRGDDYAYPYQTQGFRIGQQWGYLIDYGNGNGMFNSEEEKAGRHLNYAFGTPRVGDFIYQDLNGDGTIDDKDRAPIGYSRYPQIYYSLNAGLTCRNFELNFLLQGTAQSSVTVSGVGAYENAYQGVFNDMHRQAWTPERYAAGEKITYPALSLTTSTNHVANSFFVMDASWLRLRNLELAWTMPASLSRRIAAEKIRIALQAQNLFTLDRMRSEYIDPEIGAMGIFQPYRVYNIGISLHF